MDSGLKTSELISVLQIAIYAFYFLRSFAFLTAIIGIAGQIPVEMNNLSNAIRKKNNDSFIQKKKKFHPYLVNSLSYRPDVTLSACGLLHFTRGSILVVYGTFLAYGILIVSLFK